MNLLNPDRERRAPTFRGSIDSQTVVQGQVIRDAHDASRFMRGHTFIVQIDFLCTGNLIYFRHEDGIVRYVDA